MFYIVNEMPKELNVSAYHYNDPDTLYDDKLKNNNSIKKVVIISTGKQSKRIFELTQNDDRVRFIIVFCENFSYY